jgi:hypothetical protein
MFDSLPSDPDLLKQVLSPLLEDFQYWFDRSRRFLETEQLEFMGAEEQQQFLDRVVKAQQEVSVVQSLLGATDGQAGVEIPVLMVWHHLVMECWGIRTRQRADKSPS